jgi:prepilin-type N-terminal cleavage/methylation domain-containing protein
MSLKMKSSGFTLIELLLVIVILSILIMIALNVVNPTRMQRRSREGVVMAQVGKMCTALASCANSHADRLSCDTPAEIGINLDSLGTPNATQMGVSIGPNNNPPYASFNMQLNTSFSGGYAGPNTVRAMGVMCGEGSTSPNCTPAAWAGAKGPDDCFFRCDYNFDTFQTSAVNKTVGCY